MAETGKPARSGSFADVTPSKPAASEAEPVTKEYAAEPIEDEKPQFHPDFNPREGLVSAYSDYFTPTAVKFFFSNLVKTDLKAGI